MADAELGLKRTCVSCGARFYDLLRAPAVCPKCGTEQPPEQPRLKRAPGNVPVVKKAAPVPELEDAEDVVADAEEDPEAAEDAADDDLEDDADAIPEVEVEADRDETER